MKKNWLYICLSVLFCIGLFASCDDVFDNPVPVPPAQTEETTEPTSGDDEETEETTEPTSGDDVEDPNAKKLYDEIVEGDEIL